MRYSNVREIKNPVQHEIKDIASAWGPRSTSLSLPETQKHLSRLHTKGPPRLFGRLELQERTQVPWSGGGCVWISFGLDAMQAKYQMEVRCSGALLLGNARSGGRCRGAWGRAVHPSTMRGDCSGQWCLGAVGHALQTWYLHNAASWSQRRRGSRL